MWVFQCLDQLLADHPILLEDLRFLPHAGVSAAIFGKLAESASFALKGVGSKNETQDPTESVDKKSHLYPCHFGAFQHNLGVSITMSTDSSFTTPTEG
jgi:hypothetical protein